MRSSTLLAPTRSKEPEPLPAGTSGKSNYAPYQPARRPGGKPDRKPVWRVVVHRKDQDKWDALAGRVGLQSAQRVWDHLAAQPDLPPLIGQCQKLRGMEKFVKDGWSSIYHYEVSSMGRLDFQYNRHHQADPEKEPCPVVRILRIDLSSH